MENQFEFHEDEQQITLQDYLRILYRGRWIIIASFLTVLLATAYFTFTADPVYESTAKIMVESQGSMERALFDVTYLGNQTTLITNQVEILRSRMLAERVVHYLESVPYRDSLQIFQPDESGVYMTFRDQVEWVMNNLEVNPKKDTDIIEIKFSSRTPFEAAAICNVIAEAFRDLNREFNRSEFRELRQFLEKQLAIKEKELRSSEEALKNYRKEHRLVHLDEETSDLVSRVADIQSRLDAAMVELEAAQENKRNLEKQIDERRQSLSIEVTQVSSPLLKELQQQYAELVAEKLKYETLVKQDLSIDPQEYQLQLSSMTNRIKAIQKKLLEEAQRIATTSMVADPLQIIQDLLAKELTVDNEIKALRAKIEVLSDILSQYEAKLADLPEQSLELARLERQLQVDQNTYVLMTEKLEETKISEAGQKENIRIIDLAVEPLEPVKPKKRLNLLLGALIGIGLGVGLTFLLEYFDESIKNPEELERMGFPILSIIPQIPMSELAQKILSRNGGKDMEVQEGKLIESRLVTHFDPKSPVSEAYRTLRTNIQFKNLKNTNPMILVTSSAPKEGKSTTVANLAITLAQMGARVLLVDTDLRRPVIHSIFNLKKEKGLTNFLLGKMTFDEVIKPTIIDNLFVCTSGPLPPNPSEILSREEMKEFITIAKQQFDYLLFDSPPIIAVTDAAILASMADGCLLVIKAHQTRRDVVQRAKVLLENVNAKIFGCLLNGVNIERAYGSYYYYYYYYHYYSYYGHDLQRRKKSKIF